MHRLASAEPADPGLDSVLALPKPRASAWVVETTPAETESWLAGLVVAEPIQTAQQLYQALYTLNRMDIDPNDRFRIMELYREPVANTIFNLQSHFTRFALPLRPRLKQLSDFMRQLHLEMSFGYRHVLAVGMENSKPWEVDAFLLGVARTIETLGDVLLRSYQIYTPTPSGTWRDVHSLYRYVEHHRRHHHDLATLNGGVELTVSRIYLQVLMLGLCGPYQLPQNEVLKVQAFLSRWAGKAEIRDSIESVDPSGNFLLDLDADHPAVPFPRDVPMHLHVRPALRSVNAIELARTVHGFIGRIQKGAPPGSLDLGFESVGSACVDTLKRMLRFWGMAGRRHFTRRQRRQPLSLCVGLNALHFFASGQRPFVDPRAVDPAPVADAVVPSGADLEAEAKGAVPAAAETTSLFRVDNLWQLRDESAGGLLISRVGEIGAQIRVGDLIGILDTALEQWRIGVARWVKSPDARQLEMGVEMLAPMAHPVSVVPAGVSDAPATPALLLPAVEALHHPASLIVGRGTCQKGEDLVLIADGDPPRRVRVLNIVEHSGTFSQLVFADVSAT